jgi:DNA replication protein DnaC
MKESELTLMTCPKCNTPLETVLKSWDGTMKKFPIMCKCQIESETKRKELEEKQEKIKKLEQLKKYSLMDEKFKNWTFENYDVDEYNKILYEVGMNYCEQWDDMKREGLGLLIHGNPGIGKSYTSFCIANKLLENLTPVIAISSIGLIGKIYDSYRKYGTEGEYEIINMFNNADLLVLDDLGTEHQSYREKEKQILYSVIDTRARNGKPMIVTVNLTLLQLKEKLTTEDGVPRTYDRLIGMCTPIKVEGPSRRVISARKKEKEVLERLLRN